MKNACQLIFMIFLFASASSSATLAQRFIIQFSDLLSETEEAEYHQKISEVAPPEFKITKYDRRWILTLPKETTREQLNEIKKELSQMKKVDFIERDLPMKKPLPNPT